MSRNTIRDKKLAVLALVKTKRHILLGSIHNNEVTRQEKEEAWLEILKKAQSLELASDDRPWTYARDHLFGLWKSRALAKRSKIRKFKVDSSGRTKPVKFDKVDRAILDIVGNESPSVKKTLRCLQPKRPIEKEPPAIKEELNFLIADGVIKTEPLQTETYETEKIVEPKLNPPRRKVIKRKPKRNYSIEDVKKQVLESELYYNKLKILKLEQELGLPSSKFTEEFHNRSICSESNDFIH